MAMETQWGNAIKNELMCARASPKALIDDHRYVNDSLAYHDTACFVIVVVATVT